MDLWRFFDLAFAEPVVGPTIEELDALFAPPPPETGIEMTIPPAIAVNPEESG